MKTIKIVKTNVSVFLNKVCTIKIVKTNVSVFLNEVCKSCSDVVYVDN